MSDSGSDSETTLTVRNLTATTVTLARIERCGSPSRRRRFRRLRFWRRGSQSEDDDDEDAAEPESVFVRIAPFETCHTEISVSRDEHIRLTFAAFRGKHVVHIPDPAGAGKDDDGGDDGSNGSEPCADSPFQLFPVYVRARAHLALYQVAADERAWMQHLPDEWRLSALSLPGTHNSPACHRAPPSVRCQASHPTVQLEHGVRFFDLRMHPLCAADDDERYGSGSGSGSDSSGSGSGSGSSSGSSSGSDSGDDAEDTLVLVHSVFPISFTGKKTFRKLLGAVVEFLQANPTETVLMSIKREGPGHHTDEQLSRILHEHYVGADSDMWYSGSAIPTLGEARGKIVLVRRFNLAADLPDTDDGFGIDGTGWADKAACATCSGETLCIQDFYEIGPDGGVDEKVQYVKDQIARAASTTHTLDEGSDAAAPLFLNFLSACNFFKLRAWPKDVAAKVNPRIVEYLACEHPSGEEEGGEDAGWSTGVLVCDWVGRRGDWDLVRSIVGMNARLLP
ncbi:hypothetical protein KEM52_001329, partial [Ascosphaera acerosa]